MKKLFLIPVVLVACQSGIIELQDSGLACVSYDAESNSLNAIVTLSDCASPCDEILEESCSLGFRGSLEEMVLSTKLRLQEYTGNCITLCESISTSCSRTLDSTADHTVTFGDQTISLQVSSGVDQVVCVEN